MKYAKEISTDQQTFLIHLQGNYTRKIFAIASFKKEHASYINGLKYETKKNVLRLQFENKDFNFTELKFSFSFSLFSIPCQLLHNQVNLPVERT